MSESGLPRSALWGFLCSLLAACVANPKHQDVDKTRASVLVARGHFETGTFHRWTDCTEGFDPEVRGVIDCAPPLESAATFVVDEALVGNAHAKTRLQVYFEYAQGWPELKLGHRYEYLAALITDGSSTEVTGVSPVSRTIEGNWAIPITMAREMMNRGSYPFPCSIVKVDPEPLQFRDPRPREPLGEWAHDQEVIDELQEDGSYSVEHYYAVARKGVLLKHVSAAYAGKSAAIVSGECH
jgi:hypothetical protein